MADLFASRAGAMAQHNNALSVPPFYFSIVW